MVCQANAQNVTPAFQAADLRCAENLLACYCRDIAFPADEARFDSHTGELEVELPAASSVLRVPIAHRSLTGAFELKGPVLQFAKASESGIAPNGSRELNAIALLELLVSEISVRQDRPPVGEIFDLVRDSRDVTQLFLEHHRPFPLTFVGAEQSLTFGHPFHPAPKSRQGWNSQELHRYSPELGARFRMHAFAVKPQFVVGESIIGRPCHELVEEAVGGIASCPDGLVPIVAHPWQAQHILATGLIDRMLAERSIVHLGEVGEPVCATSSVRTLYRQSAPWFLKTSLSIRITNCVRRQAVHELRSAIAVARLASEQEAHLAATYPAFRLLSEPAWMSVDPLAGEQGWRSAVSESFGLLLRDAEPVRDVVAGGPLVAAALFGDRDLGRERLSKLLPVECKEAWFNSYVNALVPPIMHLYFNAGIMFEPHLQNVLVSGFSGKDVQILLRDFDNAKLVPGFFDSQRLEKMRPEVATELTYPHAQAWKRLIYCLVVNNLAEVAGALALGDRLMESRLWQSLRECLENLLANTHQREARAALLGLLHQPFLPTKSNLMTRIFKIRDRDAPFLTIPNPLVA